MPDRVSACENCGQTFNYGADDEASVDAEERLALPPTETSAQADDAAPDEGVENPDLEEVLDAASDAHDELPDQAESVDERDRTAISVERPALGGDTAISVKLPDGIPTSLPVNLEADPAVGLKVGAILSKRLELLAVLGNGPVGTVFKARDKKKGTVVAVKCIAARRFKTPRDRARFDAAIQAVKSLSHPNLARIYGAGREDKVCFYLMPYLEGLPLRKLLEVKQEGNLAESPGPFGFEEAEPILIQLCQAIHFAHRSTVHGGLKPENIFVQVDTLKILDVGVSRAFQPKDFWRMQADAGKEAYLAPEYTWEEPRVDRRADVYSLGVIFYEMLTGQLPEVGITNASELNPDLPRTVDAVLNRALAADPDDRYKDADAFKQDIMRVLGGDILADDLHDEPSEPSMAEEMSIDSVDVSIAASHSGAEDSAFYDDEPGTNAPVAEPEPVDVTGDHDSVSEPEPIEISAAPPRVPPDDEDDEPPPEERTPVGDVQPVEPLWVPEVADGAKARPSVSSAGAVPQTSESAGDTNVQNEPPTPQRSERREDVPTPEAAVVEPGGENGQATPSWLERDPVAIPLTDPVSGRSDPSSGRNLPLARGQQLDDEPIPLQDEASPLYEQPVGDDRTTGRTKATPDTPPEESQPETDARTRGSERATRPIPSRQGMEAQPLVPTEHETEQGVVHDDLAQEDRVTAAAAPPQPPAPTGGLARGDRPTEPKRVDGMPNEPVFTGTRPPTTRRPRATGVGDEPFRLRRSRTGARFLIGMGVIVVLFVGLGFVMAWQWSAIRGTWNDALATWSGRKSVVIPPGELCPEDMAEVPEGTFLYGSDRMDRDRDITERVAQKITINAFCIDRYEYPNEPNQTPLVGQSWFQAEQACRKEGKRLCREVEWERACKGPDSTRFPYGDRFQPRCNVGPQTNNVVARTGSHDGCTNGFGVSDMSGNVWEWTQDTFKPGTDNERVLKGGASGKPDWSGRCSYRAAMINGAADPTVGFRCCMDIKR